MARKGKHIFFLVSGFCPDLNRSQHTCIDDGGPRLDVDAGSSLPGPEDPHERLSGEDAGCFAHL